jgi:recombination protein RecA
MFGEGISREGSLIDIGVELDIVNKSGSWYSYNDEKLGQGKENSKIYLQENPKIAQEIEDKIRMSLQKKDDVPLKLGGDDTGSSIDEK